MNLLEKIILIAGLVIATGANAQQHGNGGAGVRRSGIAMTFGTANIVVDPEPRTDAEVPYLYETMDFIMQHPALTSNLKQKLFDALRPSELRRYFNIDPKKFGAVEKARLIAEFKRVIPNNNEEILLFAVTDTSKKNTFLLPTFYELTKPSEQMAILVHEAYWILNPDATYADVIRAETSAQNLFENPNDAKAILNFINIFISDSSEKGRAFLKYDTLFKTNIGFTQDSENSAQMNYELLFTKEFTDCVNRKENSCMMYFTRNLLELRKKHPQSLFLQYVTQKLMDVEIKSLTFYDIAYVDYKDVRFEFQNGCYTNTLMTIDISIDKVSVYLHRKNDCIISTGYYAGQILDNSSRRVWVMDSQGGR